MGCCSSTAADVARQRQQREIAANGLREACRRGDPVMIKALMRDEFQTSSENFVNTADESGNRPLHLVIAAGDHAECVFELLTPDERAALQSLSAEGNIRLEQERIPWSYALARLGVS